MPMLPNRICRDRSCSRSIPGDRQYCDEHKAPTYKRPGYHRFYGSRSWKKFRASFVRKFPLCEICKSRSRLTPVNVVDHIKPVGTHPHLRLVESNCRSLCHVCHNRFGAKVKYDSE